MIGSQRNELGLRVRMDGVKSPEAVITRIIWSPNAKKRQCTVVNNYALGLNFWSENHFLTSIIASESFTGADLRGRLGVFEGPPGLPNLRRRVRYETPGPDRRYRFLMATLTDIHRESMAASAE